jgi:hypothetical protein
MKLKRPRRTVQATEAAFSMEAALSQISVKGFPFYSESWSETMLFCPFFELLCAVVDTMVGDELGQLLDVDRA